MEEQKVYRAIGLMSGTSLDGVDIALLETDGQGTVKPLRSGFYPYDSAVRTVVKAGFGQADIDPQAQDLITQAHIAAVADFGEAADVVGFHGQTVFHDPDNSVTLQIGDGQALADACGMDVVCDFRKQDVAAGGQGAPFLPLYHRARALDSGLALPVAVLNIGGVSNVTWIGSAGMDDILAFDCGPGNALLDDFVTARTGAAFDAGGALAAGGHADDDLLARWMAHPFFDAPAPKSLDRDAWDVSAVEALSDADGAATLAAFSVAAIVEGSALFPAPPTAWYVTGGGRHNAHMMALLAAALAAPVQSVEALGWGGDSMEAEGFAYLAVRSLLGLPLSVPGTTGAPAPIKGGVLHHPIRQVG